MLDGGGLVIYERHSRRPSETFEHTTRHAVPRARRVLAINTPLVSNSCNLLEDEEKGRFARRFCTWHLRNSWWSNVFLKQPWTLEFTNFNRVNVLHNFRTVFKYHAGRGWFIIEKRTKRNIMRISPNCSMMQSILKNFANLSCMINRIIIHSLIGGELISIPLSHQRASCHSTLNPQRFVNLMVIFPIYLPLPQKRTQR